MQPKEDTSTNITNLLILVEELEKAIDVEYKIATEQVMVGIVKPILVLRKIKDTIKTHDLLQTKEGFIPRSKKQSLPKHTAKTIAPYIPVHVVCSG